MGCEEGALMVGFSARTGSDTRGLLSPPTCMRENSRLQPKDGVPNRHQPCWQPHLGPPATKLGETALLFKHPVYGTLSWKPELTKTVPITTLISLEKPLCNIAIGLQVTVKSDWEDQDRDPRLRLGSTT